MASVSLEDIKKLREQLGTGMVDTKNALEEAGGDLEKATEILRLKGAKGNAKRADRSTSEGLVAAHEGDGVAYLLELACETDFVAKTRSLLLLLNRSSLRLSPRALTALSQPSRLQQTAQPSRR